MNTCRVPALALSFAIGAFAAQNAPEQPKFETASVKKTERCSMQNSIDPGLITLRGDPLKVVLMEAFKVKMDQIKGPFWLDGDCFEIVAKIPEGATKEQLPAMLQALLAERFRLAFHKETQLRPGYALVVDKNGPKFKESDPNSEFQGVRAGSVRFGAAAGASGITGAMTMATLARLLSGRAGGPVEDLTHLDGKYNIDLSWVPDRAVEPMGRFAAVTAAAHPNDSLPDAPTADLFTAIRASTGLKLEPRKEQVEVIVIDSVERVPAEN